MTVFAVPQSRTVGSPNLQQFLASLRVVTVKTGVTSKRAGTARTLVRPVAVPGLTGTERTVGVSHTVLSWVFGYHHWRGGSAGVVAEGIWVHPYLSGVVPSTFLQLETGRPVINHCAGIV